MHFDTSLATGGFESGFRSKGQIRSLRAIAYATGDVKSVPYFLNIISGRIRSLLFGSLDL